MFINIYSKGKYPANMLSNFAPHEFDFDGYKRIPCMESFLQSLKFQDVVDQRRVLYMTAKEAKAYGGTRSWDRYLHWKEKKIDRFSRDYLCLIERAYRALVANPEFRQALIDSKRKLLLHTVGKSLRKNTILTWWEFVGLLYKMRKEVRRNG